VMISGRWPHFYHATKSGVRRTGFTLDGLGLYGPYRLPGKEGWG